MELVVGASTATMDSLLGKLGNLLAQEYDMIRGVRGDIQYISDELASMKAFLLDLAREDPDNRKKHWMKQIRDMAYDCEDCVDNFAHRLPNDSNLDAKCCPWIVTLVYDLWTFGPRREIASSIAELKIRAQLIADRRIRYGVENPNTQKGKGPPDASSYDIAEDQIPNHELGMNEPVGMEKAMKDLEEWVDNTGQEPAVVSIVGFGGVGKTTIAMTLYKKVMYQFDCRAWVTVSQNYDLDAVLNDILRQIDPDYRQQRSSKTGGSENIKTLQRFGSKLKRDVQRTGSLSLSRRTTEETSNQKPTENSDNKLESQIKKHLDKKRYITLVDDIWSAKTWKTISGYLLLTDNKERSRIIVTSRFQAVGSTCCRQENSDLLYPISFLSPRDSKELFNRSVSESKITKDRHKQVHNNVPEDLWKRCGGQPLALVTMAGLVACNQDQQRSYWDGLRKLLPEVSLTVGAHEQETSLNLDGVTRILDCCYNNLPGYLRTCLLYLAIFPKGCKISRKCLSRRWIAEGFVNARQGLTAEEVAESYFNHILRRKLIRPVEHNSNGKLKTFQVHDMVLDYVVTKAREENFITVVGGHLMMTATSSNNKVRRLSMQSSSSKHGDSTKGMNLSQVRSLTVFGSLTQLPFHAFNDRIIQVLDFQGLKGFRNKHMKHICKMFVLKYLSLRGTDITHLPPTIVNLEYLETLDIRETRVKELPKEVEQLKLISRILGGSKNRNPRKGLRLPREKSKKQLQHKSMLIQDKEKEGMKALRILSGIKVNETTAVSGLHQLTGLKKLTIYKLKLNPHESKISTELRSSIEYLCSCGLQTLAINEEGQSEFINSLGDMSAPPRYLVALELSGMFEKTPGWIKTLQTLSKLTLSLTVLRTETLEHLRALPLFSLTFSFSFGEVEQALNKKMKDIIEKNKSLSDGEIFVPGEGFKSLKLLRFFAPLIPKLGFCHNAMPALEMIEMQFQAFEGLFGIDTLHSLKGVRLREAKPREEDKQTAEINDLLVQELKDSTEGLKKVIIDHTFTS